MDNINLDISPETLLVMLRDLERIRSRELTDQEKSILDRSKKILSEYKADWK